MNACLQATLHCVNLTHRAGKHKRLALAVALALGAASLPTAHAGLSAVFGGGPYYKNRSVTIPEVESSGFTEAVVWNISVSSTRDLNFNGEFPLCSNGSYVGASTYPNFAADMAQLKLGGVQRVTFSIGSSNVGVWQNIKALVNSQGTGSSSILYKNFMALKNAIPAVDAFDFDDENSFDQSSTVQFALMLGGFGYKIMLDAYDNNTYWLNLASAINSQASDTVDGVHLQCYSGGAGNNPNSGWNFGSIPVYPGLSDQSDTPSQVQSTLSGWHSSGGFMWIYDDFDGTARTAQYAGAINKATGAYLSGAYVAVNQASSLALDDPGSSTSSGTIIDQATISGGTNQNWTLTQRFDGSWTLLNGASGLVLTDPNSSTTNGALLDQEALSGAHGGQNQRWFGYLNSDGTYYFANVFSGLVLDDPGASTASGTQMQQKTLNNNPSQRWTLRTTGFHLVGTHTVISQVSALALNDPNASKTSGTIINQSTVNGTAAQNWTFSQNSDGSYTLVNGASSLVLDDPGSSGSSGTLLDQATSTGGANQHWFVTQNSDGSFILVNASSGKALDDPNGSLTSGTQMEQETINANSSQRWTIH